MDIPFNSLIEVLLSLNRKDLEYVCSSDRRMREVCNSSVFWREKYRQLGLKYPGDRELREHLRSFNRDCKVWLDDIYRKLSHISKRRYELILDDWFLYRDELTLSFAFWTGNTIESERYVKDELGRYKQEIVNKLHDADIQVYKASYQVRELSANVPRSQSSTTALFFLQLIHVTLLSSIL